MLPLYEIRKADLTIKRNNYELSYPEHMHRYAEIIYVYSGVQHIIIDGKPYSIIAGNAAVIFPDIIHSYSGSGKKGDAEVLILIADPGLFGKLIPDIKNLSLSEPTILSEMIPDGMKTALNSIYPNQPKEIQFSWACVIIAYTMELLKTEYRGKSTIENIEFRLVKYIEEHFTENITRESLAEYFNVSGCYISRVFTQKFKMSLRNYLGIMRAEYAAMLIRTTDEKLTSISLMAGFGSIRSFNRVFFDTFQMTPRDYKNNIYKRMRDKGNT